MTTPPLELAERLEGLVRLVQSDAKINLTVVDDLRAAADYIRKAEEGWKAVDDMLSSDLDLIEEPWAISRSVAPNPPAKGGET